MDRSSGDWIQTFTGRAFYPFDPRPEDFHILDIAAGMRNARYANQSVLTETIGEHSVHLWRRASDLRFTGRQRRAALLHDGSEAIIMDMLTPIKRRLPDYSAVEHGVMAALAARFDFDWPLDAMVKDIDNGILFDEVTQNMGPPPAPWEYRGGTALGVRIECWSPEVTFIRFLHACAIERLI